jgi:hypothetical protein
MANLKLITETDFHDYEIITEAVEGDDKPKTTKLKGVYIQSDVVNGNGRIYKYEMLKPEVDNFIETMVKTGRALGQLEHPDYAEINPAEAAVRITSLVEDSKSWVGESVILATDSAHGIKGTPKGDIALSLVQYGTKLGFSTRGVGDVNENTGEVTKYKLVTCDLVSNPSIGQFCDSNGNRCVNGILESKDFMINTHGEIVEASYANLEKTLSNMPNTSITEKKQKFLMDTVGEFLRTISG